MTVTRGEPVEAPAVPAGFGALLRQHRLAAGLTQESLAERAGLSVHTIQKLEHGGTHPYRDTAQRLIVALQLGGTDEGVFKTAARPAPRRHYPDAFARAAAKDLARHNLPLPLTSFVPRAGETARVTQRLREARLLTITGSGGCGKTRLALEVARELVSEFADGVWLIELASLADALLVPQTIATTLGIRDEPGRPVVEALIAYFHSRHALILLDNCEHVIDACAQVADMLLRSCAHIRVLATSRELLGVGGEATWRVKSLSVVDPGSVAAATTDSIGVLLTSEAGRLFSDRARLTAASFALTARNAAAVAQVCHRLDGIPLAIELAAARLSMLGVDQIAARLDQRFWLLTGGSRTAVRRQQTLQATIDWSYDLLSDEERTLVRRLAVFAGGWSLEAAEALDADAARPHEHVPDLLGQLVAKSMVQVEEPHENESSVARYRFLETIRQYAEEKLLESGEAEVVRMRHRDWYVKLAEQAMDGMEGSDQKRWWDLLELEHDNFRAALSWSAADQRGSQQLLLLAGMLSWFWQTRWYIREGIGWLEMALAQAEATPSAARARALAWLGQLEADRSGYVERAWRLLEESIAQARVVGDQRVLSLALRHLGTAAFSCGDHVRARRLLEEGLAVSRGAGRKREIAWNLFMLGAILADVGQRDAGEPLLLESVVVGKESGDLTPVIPSLWALSCLYGMRGDLALARRTVDETMALARQLDMKYPIQALLVTLGDLASAEQDWASAADWYRQGLRAASLMAAGGAMAHALRHYAAIRGARGDHRGVVRIFGATSAVHGTSFARILDASSAGEDDLLAAARRAIGENDFALAWAEGQAITLAQAIDEILSAENEGTPR